MTNFPKTKKCIKHHKIMTYREINSKLISQDIHCTKFKILEISHVGIEIIKLFFALQCNGYIHTNNIQSPLINV